MSQKILCEQKRLNIISKTVHKHNLFLTKNQLLFLLTPSYFSSFYVFVYPRRGVTARRNLEDKLAAKIHDQKQK
jgi:hypothetical protein